MFGRLIPRDEQFFESFNELAGKLTAAAQQLVKLFDEPGRSAQHVQKLKEIEHEADDLTASVNVRLNKSFITPFDREDIHMLVSRLDDVIDLVDGAGRRYIMLHIGDVRPQAKELARVLASAADHLQQAVHGIKKPAEVERQVDAVKELEEEADAIYEQAVGALFANGGDALDVLRWKEMFDTLERTTDYCMRVAQVLRSISLKNA
jgi:predicted phosphate transport protein (TIGR00153 family)